MRSAVISDSSCFIALMNIGRSELLRKVYDEVLTTPQIASEVGPGLPAWVVVNAPGDHAMVARLGAGLDPGEASAIALAIEIPGTQLVLDEIPARKVARALGLVITGTLGVLISAKVNGDLPAILPVLNELERVSFRMSAALRRHALYLAGEE